MTEIAFNADLSAEKARELFDYYPATGLLVWKVSRKGKTKPGNIAGSRMGQGYISIEFAGRQYLAHRLAWLITYGEWPALFMDHIDGKKDNNALANLRLATKRQNCQNAKRRRGGCTFHKQSQTFRASICVDGKHKHLGSFLTREEGEAAYLAATIEHFGEFSAAHRLSSHTSRANPAPVNAITHNQSRISSGVI